MYCYQEHNKRRRAIQLPEDCVNLPVTVQGKTNLMHVSGQNVPKYEDAHI